MKKHTATHKTSLQTKNYTYTTTRATTTQHLAYTIWFGANDPKILNWSFYYILDEFSIVGSLATE